MAQRLLAGTQIDEQINLETECVAEGVKRYARLVRDAEERGEGASLKPAERLIAHWIAPLTAAIEEERKAIQNGTRTVGVTMWGPALLLLDDPRVYAVATIRTVLNAVLDPDNATRLPFTNLAHKVGSAVMAECVWFLMRRDHPDAQKELENHYKRINAKYVNRWGRTNLNCEIWTRSNKVHLGTRLLWLLRETASADAYDKEFRVAFRWQNVREGKRIVRMFEMDRACWRVIDDGHSIRQFMRPLLMPMVVPPTPWQKGDGEVVEGGYMRIRVPPIAKIRRAQRKALIEHGPGKAFEAMNALGATRWRVNKFILATQKKIIEQGGGECGLPLSSNPPKPPYPADTSDDSIKAWNNRAHRWHQECTHLAGRRFELGQTLHIANRMVGYDAFYLPHNMDFRGRFYPVPVYLNHHGDDTKRGLLEFADGVDIGRDGLREIAIHAANCWANDGLDKKSFDERVTWVFENSTDIGLCSRDPIKHRWWMQAENPWQFLAACRALDDPDGAGSHIPVQKDGTCNGLQHYAAIGRDTDAAALVNMIDGDRPSDIYSRVFERASVGDDPKLAMLSRSVVKQPVMTTVYGVTAVGARSQVAERLKEKHGLEGKALYEASRDLSKIVRDAVGSLCVKATEIMDWMKRLALLCNRKGVPVEWTSPLGMRVVSPYRSMKTVSIHTCVGDMAFQVDMDGLPIRKQKQVNAFPPNYIHGVDAAHLGMTAIKSREEGVTFAGVHDSFWTHAGYGHDMDTIARQEFVELHQRDLLGELAANIAALTGTETPPPPERGSLDLSCVLSSRYFFH